MLICLGIGYLLARGAVRPGRALACGAAPLSREARRRPSVGYLPFLALVTMAVALVFTLSRGAVVELLCHAARPPAGPPRALGRIRRSLALIGALLIATLGYAAWIGLEPLLARVWHADYAARWHPGG